MITTIKNVHPVSPEVLFSMLKKDFIRYINQKMDSSLEVDYAHVYDVINIYFPEIIEGTVFTLIVNDEAVELSSNGDTGEYNVALLEQH